MSMMKKENTRKYLVQLVLNGVIGVFENSHPRRVRKKISCSIFQGGSHGGTIIGKAQNMKCILVTCALSNLIKNELVSWPGWGISDSIALLPNPSSQMIYPALYILQNYRPDMPLFSFHHVVTNRTIEL